MRWCSALRESKSVPRTWCFGHHCTSSSWKKTPHIINLFCTRVLGVNPDKQLNMGGLGNYRFCVINICSVCHFCLCHSYFLCVCLIPPPNLWLELGWNKYSRFPETHSTLPSRMTMPNFTGYFRDLPCLCWVCLHSAGAYLKRYRPSLLILFDASLT